MGFPIRFWFRTVLALSKTGALLQILKTFCFLRRKVTSASLRCHSGHEPLRLAEGGESHGNRPISAHQRGTPYGKRAAFAIFEDR